MQQGTDWPGLCGHPHVDIGSDAVDTWLTGLSRTAPHRLVSWNGGSLRMRSKSILPVANSQGKFCGFGTT
jgi:hypothetical protein